MTMKIKYSYPGANMKLFKIVFSIAFISIFLIIGCKSPDEGDDSDNGSGTGSYVLNGITTSATHVELNMVITNPKYLQINLHNNNENPRHLVQVTSAYTSKQAFDSTFNNNTLLLINNNILGVGMEYDGSFHYFNQGSFSLTITKNQDGTYDFFSSGSMVSQDTTKVVTDIMGENVKFYDYNGY